MRDPSIGDMRPSPLLMTTFVIATLTLAFWKGVGVILSAAFQ